MNKNGSPYCKACCKVLKGGFTHFKRHGNTTFHQQNIQKSKTPKLTHLYKGRAEANFRLNTSKRAELKLIGFISKTQLTIPFNGSFNFAIG